MNHINSFESEKNTMNSLQHNKMFNYEQDESLKIKYLQIEPTNVCNLDCQFCSRKFKNQAPKHLSLPELERITDQFEEIRFIKLQGLGECFFAPNLADQLAHLKRRYADVRIMCSSNLNYRKTDGEISEVLENLDLLYLSIDGGNKETYERIRRGGDWDTCMATLLQFAKLKRAQNEYSLSFIASGDNFRDIESVVGLAEDMGLDEVRINPVQDWTTNNRLTQSQDYCNPEYIGELRKWHFHESPKCNVIVVGDPCFEYAKCIWPFERVYIDVYGAVFVCVISLDDRWSYGNIFRQSLEEIYASQFMKRIRHGLKNNKPPLHCRTCSYKQLVPCLRSVKGDCL